MSKPKLSFSGHQTFPFRYTWLKKAVDGICVDPALLKSDDAIVKLGVGKNMVDSIQHWGLTTGVLEKNEEDNTFFVTSFGNSLFAQEGWDPYLEDNASLWLLHWRICTNGTKATTWQYAFNKLNTVDFSKEDLFDELMIFAAANGTKVSTNIISRDIDCFIRTYVPSRNIKASLLEDSLDCPLTELSIIQEAGHRGIYMFIRGPRQDLPNEIFVYTLIEYWNAMEHKRNILSFEDIVYGENSPGQIFKIDEDSMAYRLDGLEKLTGKKIRFDETSGLRQVYIDEKVESIEFLEKYYKKSKELALT